jgi:ATP-dependent protease ClpP protease subunit
MNEVYLTGTVGESFWGEQSFTASMVREALDGKSGPLTIYLNSGGGVATDGMAIYSMLDRYDGEITVVIDGVAASAASLIAMAGDAIVMPDGAWMLIHDPASMWTEGRGTSEDHRKQAEFLDAIATGYAKVYAKRAGISVEDARAIMKDETVMGGEMAIMMGFATGTSDAKAPAAADFDYRVYAHAPEALRMASETKGLAPKGEAVMAMIAGNRATMKEAGMADIKEPAVDEKPAVVQDPAPVVQDAPVAMAAVAQERARARRIAEATANAGLPVTFATDLIDRGVTMETALESIIGAWKEKGDVDTPMPGRPTAKIIRDEHDTRRQGMTGAIHAQLAKVKDVSGPERHYMAMPIYEMAALAIDDRSPLRSPSDRQRVLEMAFHTTSDFPAVLENALNKRLAEQFAMQAPTYKMVAEQMDFTDFRPHPISQISDFPLLTEVAQNGEIKFGTLSEKKETVTLRSYASGLKISRQTLINDDMGAIDRAVRGTANAVAATEDQIFWAMVLSASAAGPTLTETGRAVFNTTDGTLAGSASAITTAALAIGRAAIRKRKRLDGSDLEAVPTLLVVGPDKQTEAEQIIAPLVAAQVSNVNVFTGTMQIVTTAKITGNAWYMFADPSVLPVFMYGFLSGDAGPRVRMEEPFGMQGASWTCERDFGCGAVGWRGGYRNAGA